MASYRISADATDGVRVATITEVIDSGGTDNGGDDTTALNIRLDGDGRRHDARRAGHPGDDSDLQRLQRQRRVTNDDFGYTIFGTAEPGSTIMGYGGAAFAEHDRQPTRPGEWAVVEVRRNTSSTLGLDRPRRPYAAGNTSGFSNGFDHHLRLHRRRLLRSSRPSAKTAAWMAMTASPATTR